MIVKKLKLENIRSYKDQIVEFPPGRTLFEGDIGSGKSTILMAIEFALFGLGSEKGGSLLKAGENEGSVSIIFESDGKEYTVQRKLVRKKNSYVQDDCVLRTENEYRNFSASEIKEKVLEILDFNEPPDPKAQSLIYRYAIYTPQEEIKNVLSLKPDLRLQTLRKVFKLEDYKVAAENAKNVYNEIRQKARDFEKIASDVPSLKERIRKLDVWVSEKSRELERFEQEQEEKKSLLNELKTRIEKLQTDLLSLKSETGKITTLSSLVNDKKRVEDSSRKQISLLDPKIKQLEAKIESLRSQKNPSEKSPAELQGEIERQEERDRELRDSETQIKAKLKDYRLILSEKVCPTCDQPIEANSFSEKLKHKQDELESAHGQVEECTNVLQQLKKLLDVKKNYDLSQSNLKEYLSNQEDNLSNLKNFKEMLESARKTIVDTNQELEKAQSSIQKLKETELELKKRKDGLEECNEDLQYITNGIAAGRADIANWKRETRELEESIKVKLEQKRNAEKLSEYMIWIQDYFMPTIEAIEKQVMMSINTEFDTQFQRWFGMLVDDPGKEAKIDEDFTPIVQQDGIDQEVSYLSGGEKTSVALAYRLALNNIVRRVSTGMHSNVLILDEPTDGFSKEQLGKVREILDELQCPQIILVSHERELESFADQIYRVSKSNGISRISGGS